MRSETYRITVAGLQAFIDFLAQFEALVPEVLQVYRVWPALPRLILPDNEHAIYIFETGPAVAPENPYPTVEYER